MGAVVGAIIGCAMAVVILLPLVEKSTHRMADAISRTAFGARLRRRAEPPKYSDSPGEHWLGGEHRKRRVSLLVSAPPAVADPVVLVYGAGLLGGDFLRRAGSGTFYCFGEEELLDIEIYGFIDDDPQKHGKQTFGIAILGGVADLADILKRYEEREGTRLGAVVLAIADPCSDHVQEALDTCKEFDVPFYRFGFGFRRLDK